MKKIDYFNNAGTNTWREANKIFRSQLIKASPNSYCKRLVSLTFELQGILYNLDYLNSKSKSNFGEYKVSPEDDKKFVALLKRNKFSLNDVTVFNQEAFECIKLIIKKSNGIEVSMRRAKLISFLERFIDIFYPKYICRLFKLERNKRKLASFRKATIGKNTCCIYCGKLLTRTCGVYKGFNLSRHKGPAAFYPSRCRRSENRRCVEHQPKLPSLPKTL